MSKQTLEQALETWQEKLAAYECDLSLSADPSLKFELRKRIQECEREIERISIKLKSLEKDIQVFAEEVDRLEEIDQLEKNEAISLKKSISLNMHILHLSDLHFGTLAQAQLWSGQLIEDLQNNLNIDKIDALILSGDIANKSTHEEYQFAKKFLDEFLQDFNLEPGQIIIVPGNHDINWDLSKEAYTLKDKDKCIADELREGYYISVNDDVVRTVDKEKYLHRFSNFNDFYNNYKDNPYQLDVNQQYSLDVIGDKILILGLNSAWQLDHHFKNRASINNIALTNALTEIRRNNIYKNCPVKIAVWHHPINSPYEDRVKNSDFLQRLAVNDFHLFLHGHVHKAENDKFCYDHNIEGRKLHRICAGTFGAPTKELNTGIPWQYNLLTFQTNKVKVDTRKRESENGAWEGDFRWRDGKDKSLNYYQIELQSIEKSAVDINP
jgi:predicted MPP superfamily phosphohydrolase